MKKIKKIFFIFWIFQEKTKIKNFFMEFIIFQQESNFFFVKVKEEFYQNFDSKLTSLNDLEQMLNANIYKALNVNNSR